jgi:hypothetical protein
MQQAASFKNKRLGRTLSHFSQKCNKIIPNHSIKLSDMHKFRRFSDFLQEIMQKGDAVRHLPSARRKSPAGAGLFLIDMVEWARVMKRCWNAGKWIEIW